MERGADDEFIGFLSDSTSLPPALVRRLVGDVMAHLAETVDDYVLRRHRELTAAGLKNDAIYERLAAEVAARPFAVPAPSRRQIRRLIYG